MLNFGASKPRVKGGPGPRGPPGSAPDYVWFIAFRWIRHSTDHALSHVPDAPAPLGFVPLIRRWTICSELRQHVECHWFGTEHDKTTIYNQIAISWS